jgi:hypothetical protein
VLRQISFLIRFALPFFGSVPRGFNGNTEPQDNARGIMGTALAMPVALAVLLLGLGVWFLEVPL